MVRLKLFRDGKQYGEEMTAYLDWREHGAELRTYLEDAVVTRAHCKPEDIGQFELHIADAKFNKHRTKFVGVSEHRVNEMKRNLEWGVKRP